MRIVAKQPSSSVLITGGAVIILVLLASCSSESAMDLPSVAMTNTDATDQVRQQINSTTNPLWNLIKLLFSYLITFIFGGLVAIYLNRKITLKIRDEFQLETIQKDTFFKKTNILAHASGTVKLCMNIIEQYSDAIKNLEYKLKRQPHHTNRTQTYQPRTATASTQYHTQERQAAPPISQPIQTVQEEVEKEIVETYFSIPTNDGHFLIDKAESQKTNQTFYKITHKKGAEEGEIEFLKGVNDVMAINHLEKILEPVCEYNYISELDGIQTIIVKEKGRVQLIENEWRIDPEKKITIQLR